MTIMMTAMRMGTITPVPATATALALATEAIANATAKEETKIPTDQTKPTITMRKEKINAIII